MHTINGKWFLHGEVGTQGSLWSALKTRVHASFLCANLFEVGT
jgi:hypothetical protein